MDVSGGSSQPVQHPPTGGASLRRAWREGIASLGPEAALPGLEDLLESRLAALEQRGALDEPSLLSVAEEAAHLALETGSADLARSLSKRLRRSIYEFLLALDAAPAAAAALPVAPLEPVRPARWGQVLIGVEEVEQAQRDGEIAPRLDLDNVVGADDTTTAETVRSISRSESGQADGAWREAEAGRLVELADAATEEVTALRALLEEAMANGLEVELPTLPGAEAPADHTVAIDAVRAYAAAEAEAARNAEEERLAAEAAAGAAEEERLWAEAAAARAAEEQRVAAEAAAAREAEEARAEALLREIEDAEEAAARTLLLRLRVMEALPPPGIYDREAMRVPAMFRREPVATATAPLPAAPPDPVHLDATAPPPGPAYRAAERPRSAPAYRVGQPEPAAPEPASPTTSWPEPPGVPLAAEAPPSLFPIAPREGFHLTDPSMVAEAMNIAPAPLPAQPPAAPPLAAAPAPVAPVPAPQSRWSLPSAGATASPAVEPAPASPMSPADAAEMSAAGPTGWNVRQSPRQQMLTERMAQKRREEAVQAAQEAAAIAAALAEPERKGRRWGKGPTAPERIPDVATGRDLVEEQLRRKRGAEAAALLQRIAAELPGRETADLALDSGDRCLALGQNRSATNCYLAGWRADPSYEAPLWRLADVCLADREVALATGYLERVAELMRSRGDDAGALAVYRKIITVAPDREDIRRLVRLAQATGRLEV